jgi:iron complex transport system substrate-binding protein
MKTSRVPRSCFPNLNRALPNVNITPPARLKGPQRIVCLTEETTELLYALGEQDRIVGITAYTERPPAAKRDKPVVSAFVGGSIDRIRALKPDLIIGFSDVQAEYARSLIHAGFDVLITNQRSLDDIFQTLTNTAALVHAHGAGQALLDQWWQALDATQARCQQRSIDAGGRPSVYFEEWDEPMISCIHWVSELIEIAGGRNIFADRATGAASKERYCSVEEVRHADPDILLASWCGKPFDAEAAMQRLGKDIRAFACERVHEIPAEIILQPGPACLTDGIAALEAAIWPGHG